MNATARTSPEPREEGLAGKRRHSGKSAYTERADFLPPTALPPTARPVAGARFMLDCATVADEAAQGAEASRMIKDYESVQT